jgi:hypothetical protein
MSGGNRERSQSIIHWAASSRPSVVLFHFGNCAGIFTVSEYGRLFVIYPVCAWGSSIRSFTEHRMATTAPTHSSRTTTSSPGLGHRCRDGPCFPSRWRQRPVLRQSLQLKTVIS